MVLVLETVEESGARVSMCRCRVGMTAALDTHVCSVKWTNCPSRGLQTGV